MPYKSARELPKSVRDALPKEACHTFLRVVNNALKQYEGDEERANKVAYNAVKGKALQERYKVEEAKHIAEEAKNIAANAGGGASQTTAKIEDKNVLDELMGDSKNPNTY